jgi:predicted dehydrogenase
MGQEIRVGLMGLGRMALAYEATLKQSKDLAHLVAVCDIVEKKIENRVKRGMRGYTDYREFVKDPDIDVIFITTSHNGTTEDDDPHYEHALAALENNKHVMVEKPMTVTAKTSRQLVDTAAKRNLKFTTAENTRFVPGYMFVDEHVKSGKLGDICFIRSSIDGSSIEELTERRTWLCKKPHGGVILDMGVHTFYLLKWIFGGVRDISCFSHKTIQEADLEDNAVFTGHLMNGGYYVSSVSTIAKVPWTERLEVYGKKGAIIVDHLNDPTVFYYSGSDEQIKPEPVEEVPYEPMMWKWKSIAAEITDFLESVRDDRSPKIDPEDGYYAVMLSDAAYKSAQSGEVVPIS